MSKYIIKNNIRKLRFLSGEITQQELADKTGVTRQTIIAVENSKYSPSLDLAFRIANVFNVSVVEVFSYEIERNEKGLKSDSIKHNKK